MTEGDNSAFIGYTSHEATTRVSRWRADDKGHVDLLLLTTPFYAESGGQVGDTGVIETNEGALRFEVTDTQKATPGLIHSTKLVKREPVGPVLHQDLVERVDAPRRPSQEE